MMAVCRSFKSSTLNRGRGEYPLLPIITPSPLLRHINRISTGNSQPLCRRSPLHHQRSEAIGLGRPVSVSLLDSRPQPCPHKYGKPAPRSFGGEGQRLGGVATPAHARSAPSTPPPVYPTTAARARAAAGRTGPNRRDVAQACAYGRATARVRALARSRWASLLWALDLACVGVRTRSSARER